MRKARFTTEQIITILQEHAAGAEPGDLIHRHGISRATLYHWKKQYGNLQVSDAKRLKAREDENRRAHIRCFRDAPGAAILPHNRHLVGVVEH